MISYLNGRILKKWEKGLILTVNGVGYEVKANTNLLSEVKEKDEVELYIHTHVREDEISLYGFNNFDELGLFKMLISVSGIGPKIGLEILNQPIDMIKNAIFTEDIALLSKTPGLGKKTSQKLVLELKNKVEPTVTVSAGTHASPTMTSDVIEALENLGYTRHQITKGLTKVDPNLTEAEAIITAFLKEAYTQK